MEFGTKILASGCPYYLNLIWDGAIWKDLRLYVAKSKRVYNKGHAKLKALITRLPKVYIDFIRKSGRLPMVGKSCVWGLKSYKGRES